jgi:hypothetical protein
MAEPVLKRRRTEPASDPAAVDAPEERDVPFEHSRFFLAAALGDLDAAIAAHTPAELERADALGRTALMAAAGRGHLDVVRWLVAARGADATRANHAGGDALMYAAAHGHANVARYLADAGRCDLAARDAAGATAIALAARHGHLLCVQVLAARGADHGGVLSSRRAARCPEHVRAWLEAARGRSSPLQFLDAITPREACALLRAGADIDHDRDDGDDEARAPSPRALARVSSLQTAAIVRRAAAPWGRANHDMFPRGARARAAELLVIGRQIAKRHGRSAEAGAVEDCWLHSVMQYAVNRADGVVVAGP